MARRSKHSAPAGTLVLLVRHGATPTTGAVLPGRAKGLHLSDTGRSQADAVAQRIADAHRGRRKVDAIYVSPLERTRETARPIARAVEVRAKVDRGLLECDFGEWTGQELKELRKLREWRTVQRNPSGFRFPAGESFTEMQARAVTAVDRLRRAHPGGVVIAVSHADPIKAVVAHAMGTHLDLFQRVVVSPCSVSAVLYTDEGPIVLTVNSNGDLAGLTPS
jgi:probable phosphomutase (TIGR03848 family)